MRDGDFLAAAEQRFEAMRRLPPDPWAACAEVLDPRWFDAARAIDRALAAAPGELAYHNRHHFAEATLAMGWLCRIARAAGRLDAADAGAGVLAMLGHDIDHDGSAATDGRLEAASAARVAVLARAAGLEEGLVSRIVDVILATNPALVARNAAGCGTPAGLLRRLANEADVFASLLPRLGRRLGEDLAVERRLPPGRAVNQERLGFLLVYEGFSEPAQLLGIAGLHGDQVAAYRVLGDGVAAAGAARLDGMAAAVGETLYDRTLDAIRSKRRKARPGALPP